MPGRRARFGIGQPVRRVEDRRFLSGHGRYIDDMHLEHQCHAAMVLSPHAHARIIRVDTGAALAAEGVLCVLTGADALADGLGGFVPLVMPQDRRGGPKAYATRRPPLATDRVRFVGERVAVVVAATEVQARLAAELVEVDYEPLPAVVRVEDAIRPGAPRLWEDCPDNVSFELSFGDAQQTAAVFAAAPHVVSLELTNNRLSANPIEPRGAIGHYDPHSERYTLYTSSQNPHGVRTALARDVLRIPESHIRVVTPDVGGGFGLKSNPHPEDALVLWASRRCGRPVKWIATRSESLVGDNHARDQRVHGEMALDETGRILAIRAQALQALGAYTFAAVVAPIEFSVMLIPSVYDVRTVHLVARGVFTHTTTLSTYRGAGRPEAIYLTERLLDLAARRLGMDPVAIRRRNFIAPGQFPYPSATGFVYENGEFGKVMDRCLQMADWSGFAARRAASEARGTRRGRAISYYIEQGGRFNDRMELRFDPGGSVSIVAGTHNHGQGHATTYAQMVSEWLGIDFENIRFIQGDTDAVPFGRGTFAARSSMIGGCALRAAADGIIAKARLMAAHLMEVPAEDLAFADGQFSVTGTDRGISLVDVARAFYRPVGLPAAFGLGLEASGSYAAEPPNHPNGCHICEVEIDPQTGSVRIDRYTVVDDAGRIINPMICEGQVHGGLAQGIGQALCEQIVYDRDSGQLLSGSFMDYCMPRAEDLPAIHTGFEELPAPTNPLGVKGIGEAGSIGSTPTAINAILDALAPLGVTHIDMPATPQAVWRALQAARAV